MSAAKDRAAARFVPKHMVAVQPLVEEVDELTPKDRAAARFQGQHGATVPTTIIEKGSAKDRARLRFEPMAQHPSAQRIILVNPPSDAATQPTPAPTNR